MTPTALGKRRLLNTLFVLAVVLVPLLLGALIVGRQAPLGRNTRSATRVGHKALFLLTEQLGYDARRFERGVETLPDRPAVLIALEPGPALFRERGRYAASLIRWIEKGNAALVTLGPDQDRLAELDDVEGELGARARRAIEIAEQIRRSARDRAGTTTTAEDRPAQRPQISPLEPELEANDSWDSDELAQLLDLPLLEDRLSIGRTSTLALSGPFAAIVGETGLDITRPRAWLRDPRPTERAGVHRELLGAGDRELMIELSLGRGTLILLSEPRLFQNGAIARAGHARLAVRTIESLSAAAGSDVLLFEEFSHGARELGSVFDLAFYTRARWPMLQLLLMILAWIAMVAWRSRSVVPYEATPRRSRDEVIDSMASLFLRASDTTGAAQRLLELSRRRLLRTLPAGAEAELVPLLAARLGRDPKQLEADLDPATVHSAKDLVARARALRALRVAAEAQR